MGLQSSLACYNSRVPDARDYKVLPKTPTKKWVVDRVGFEPGSLGSRAQISTTTPRPIPSIGNYSLRKIDLLTKITDLFYAEVVDKLMELLSGVKLRDPFERFHQLGLGALPPLYSLDLA